jgi:hypothetical protein
MTPLETIVSTLEKAGHTVEVIQSDDGSGYTYLIVSSSKGMSDDDERWIQISVETEYYAGA